MNDAVVRPSKKLNTRWRKGAQRYSSDRTVEHSRYVKTPDGARRRKTDSPSEVMFVSRMHEPTGWRNGARVRKLGD